MNSDALREALHNLTHMERTIFFESINNGPEPDIDRVQLNLYADILRTTGSYSNHNTGLALCRTFIHKNNFITLPHARQHGLINSNVKSTTWSRCYIAVLVKEGLIELHETGYKPEGHRGSPCKVYVTNGFTPSFVKGHASISIIDNPTQTAEIFIDGALGIDTKAFRGAYSTRQKLITSLKKWLFNGVPVLGDINRDSVEHWLYHYVRPLVSKRALTQPFYANYDLPAGSGLVLLHKSDDRTITRLRKEEAERTQTQEGEEE